MSVIQLRPGDLPKLLADHAARLPKAVNDGIVLGAHRGRRHLVSVSPVDTGLFKNSWRVREYPPPLGADLFNDAPHAGVIEKGARPHKVSKEGFENILAWVKRKIMLGGTGGETQLAARDERGRYTGVRVYGPRLPAHIVKQRKQAAEQQARSITWAIIKNIEKHGQEGLHLVETSLDLLGRFAAQEVARMLHKALGRP